MRFGLWTVGTLVLGMMAGEAVAEGRNDVFLKCSFPDDHVLTLGEQGGTPVANLDGMLGLYLERSTEWEIGLIFGSDRYLLKFDETPPQGRARLTRLDKATAGAFWIGTCEDLLP